MTEDACKEELAKIINRVVLDEAEKRKIVRKICPAEGVFPFKSIIYEMERVEMLPMNKREKEVFDEIKFIYMRECGGRVICLKIIFNNSLNLLRKPCV